MSRDRILALFWPESPEARARHTLKQTLYALRRDLDAPELLLGTQELRLNPAVITSDVAELEAAAARGDHAAVVSLFGGPLLDGVHAGGAPELEQFIALHRDRLSDLFARSAEAEAAAAQERGDYHHAVVLWRRLAALDPYSGRIALGLVRALAMDGDRTGALQFARVYESLVRNELHAEPEPEVLEFAEALRRGEHVGPSARPEAPEVVTRPLVTSASATAPPADAPRGVHADVPLLTPTDVPPVPVAGGGAANGTAPPAHADAQPLPRWRRLLNRRPVILGSALLGPVAVAGILIAAASDTGDHPQLVEQRVAVLPCETASAAASPPITSTHCEALIKQALRHWTDLQVVDQLVVDDRTQRSSAATRAERLRLARDLGARLAVLASVTPTATGSLIEARLYDVATRDVVRAHTVTLPAELRDVDGRMRELVAALLARTAQPGENRSLLGTRRIGAWRALQRGMTSLGAWDLAAARDAFRAAAADDSSYADAAYWLAQVEHWLGEAPIAARRGLAARAVALSDKLPERERAQARALAHLVNDAFQDACADYDRLIAADSVNLVAWLGRADCHARDNGVVPDPSSRTGWSFRGSRKAAIESYERALSIAPTAFRMFAMPRFSRLRAIYPTNPLQTIRGVGVDDPTQTFVAFPELQADTIALVPIPLDPIRGITDPSVVPRNRAVAAQRASRLLRDLTALWVAADGTRPEAHEAHALALEENGEVLATLSGNDALWHVRRAQELLGELAMPDTSVQALRLGVAEVRLLVKRGSYAEAHDRAAALLTRSNGLGAAGAREVLPLAALLGRLEQLESLVRRATVAPTTMRPELLDVPGVPQAVADQELLLVAILSGLPSNVVGEYHRRLMQTLEREVPETERARVRDMLLAEVMHVGLLVLPPGVEQEWTGRLTLAAEAQRFARDGRVAEASERLRARMEALRAQGSAQLPSEWLVAARVALAIGDSATATELLDRGLAALPRGPSNVLSIAHVAAAIPELAALRASLNGVGEGTADARRWAIAADALRRTADPQLRRMMPQEQRGR